MHVMLKFFFLVCAVFVSVAHGVEQYKVKSVVSKLYLQHTGSLSGPLQESEPLWNVIIGEGGISEPSKSVLVDVVLGGPPGGFSEQLLVNLVVKSARSGKVISKHSTGAGVFSISGEYHVPFFLLGTGCEPLLLVASLRGADSSVEARIPFECGE